MTITCVLYSNAEMKVVTDTKIEVDGFFGITSANPFPASHFSSGAVFEDSVILNYRIDDAQSELKSEEGV